jgi:hypothetical protein
MILTDSIGLMRIDAVVRWFVILKSEWWTPIRDISSKIIGRTLHFTSRRRNSVNRM